MSFDLRQTNILKGVSVSLLLWHHLFLNNTKLCVTFLTFHGIPLVKMFADISKCCVALFIFLSGYGLFKSYSSYLEKNTYHSSF